MMEILFFIGLLVLSCITAYFILDGLYEGSMTGLFGRYKILHMRKGEVLKDKYEGDLYISRDMYIVRYAELLPFPWSYGVNSYRWTTIASYLNDKEEANEVIRQHKKKNLP